MQKVKTETIIRTVVLIVALINQFLTMSGKSILPFSNEEIEAVLSWVFTAGASLWAWWKNNSFTPEAIKADAVLADLRGK